MDPIISRPMSDGRIVDLTYTPPRETTRGGGGRGEEEGITVDAGRLENGIMTREMAD